MAKFYGISYRLDEDGSNFIRVRVSMNILAKLPRGTNIYKGEMFVPIFFLYERLHNFCYYCGIVDHVFSDWEEALAASKSMYDCQYGDWMFGFPPRHTSWQGEQGRSAEGAQNAFANWKSGSGFGLPRAGARASLR